MIKENMKKFMKMAYLSMNMKKVLFMAMRKLFTVMGEYLTTQLNLYTAMRKINLIHYLKLKSVSV